MATETVSIVGAGLVGSLLSVGLAQKGYNVQVFERRPDMRAGKVDAGRSINLALSNRGWRALESVGIAGQVRKVAIPMRGRMIHGLDGETTFQPYGKEDEAIYSVSRAGLNMTLMDCAEAYSNVRMHFSQRCLNIDLDTAAIDVYDEREDRERQVTADLTIGSDGAFSAVRQSMQHTDRFNYSQSYLEHGYKELAIPPGRDGGWQIEKEALHIWPRGRYMLIALPNLDGSFTCTLFFPFEGNPSFASLQSPADIQAFFEATFPDAVPLMPTLLEDYAANPTSSLVTVRCYPWVHGRKAALIGDAAHAIVPFYGQGMNAGFEDCRIFIECLEACHRDWPSTLEAYQTARKANADAIAELAIRNFLEMRDKVADPMFLLRKRLEKKIHAMYPEKFLPVYSMVTFSHQPYTEALNEIGRQDALLGSLLAIPDIENQWDSATTEQRIRALMAEY